MAFVLHLFRVLLTTLLAGVLGACASPAPPMTIPDQQLTLELGQRTALTPALAISFDDISDSRCPADVQCFWAGKLLYRMSLHHALDEPFTLEKAAPAYTSPTGLRIALADQPDPPRPTTKGPRPHYTVTLALHSTTPAPSRP